MNGERSHHRARSLGRGRQRACCVQRVVGLTCVAVNSRIRSTQGPRRPLAQWWRHGSARSPRRQSRCADSVRCRTGDGRSRMRTHWAHCTSGNAQGAARGSYRGWRSCLPAFWHPKDHCRTAYEHSVNSRLASSMQGLSRPSGSTRISRIEIIRRCPLISGTRPLP